MDVSFRRVAPRVRRHLSDHRVFYSIFLPFVLVITLAAIVLYLMLVELRLAPLRMEQLGKVDAAKGESYANSAKSNAYRALSGGILMSARASKPIAPWPLICSPRNSAFSATYHP